MCNACVVVVVVVVCVCVCVCVCVAGMITKLQYSGIKMTKFHKLKQKSDSKMH